MRYMLDTSICIYILKHEPIQVRERFERHNLEDVCVSCVTVAELEYGAAKSARPESNARTVGDFLDALDTLAFDPAAARHYGGIRAALERSGRTIGPLDMLIAAHARSQGLTLVTNNVREFVRVPGLTVENWQE